MMKSRHRTSPELARRTRPLGPLSVAVPLSVLLAGCVTSPVTGDLFPDSTLYAQRQFAGRTDLPNATVTAYVLGNANDNPLRGTYVQIGGTTGEGGAGHDGNDPKPYYEWGFTSIGLTQTQWPQGGLVRFKVRGGQNGSQVESPFATGDVGSAACVEELSTKASPESWIVLGNSCQAPYGAFSEIITVASTSPTPAELAGDQIPYLGYGAGHHYASDVPHDHVQDTTDYYASIDAPGTLTAFRQKYQFGLLTETRAIYYNEGDLGVARDMHCAKYTPPSGLYPKTACYVTNFGRESFPPVPSFGLINPQAALDQALAEFSGETPFPIATVAMVYDPAKPANQDRVQFIVYDQDGNRSPFAALDNHGVQAIGTAEDEEAAFNLTGIHDFSATTANITVPDNCLACHGLDATYTRTSEANGGAPPGIAGASFLPFDEESMIFSTNNATYSAQNMRAKLKKLNAMVYDTAPRPAVIELLNGMYKNPRNSAVFGPKSSSTVFTPDYVPAGWNTSPAANHVYTEVVKPYCRTCHVTAAASLDWDSWAELSHPDWSNAIKGAVCEGGIPMPHAEHTQTRFWRSAARPVLVNALGLTTACAP